MISIQNCNRFNRRLLFPNLFFNKRSNVMICSNKCSFPMQMYKKVAALQEQQSRMFWHRCILQNSPNAASSMPILDFSEATTATNEEFPIGEEKEAQQQLEETEKQAKLTTKVPNPIQKEFMEGPKNFANWIYPRLTRKRLIVKYEMGKSGQKFLQLDMKIGTEFFHFPKILVPEDVFAFVRAMDEVLKEVHGKKNIIEASTNHQETIILHTTKAKGMDYDYRLHLRIFNNFVQVQMSAVPNESSSITKHKLKYEFLSLHQFHWLRHRIGELFENGEENVQEQLGKPPDYPNWLNLEGIPHVLLTIRRSQLQQRPVNRENLSNLRFAQQRGIRQLPSNTSNGYNNRNQYNSIPNLWPDDRRNLQAQQTKNMQFDERQPPERVAPVQQQTAQPQMPSSWTEMSEQLLQLVFLQQQQLQQIQSAILKDQPMGGVGGAIAQKMGPDNTILMSELVAQAPSQPQSAMPKWNRNNVGYRKNWSDHRYSSNQGYRTDDEY